MSQTIDTPIFNLKAVVQETGLKPDTLRAWERRYGLPKPQRTSSGHRLYTQRDIATLKWLMARQDEGLNISRAVALWHETEREHVDPFQVQSIEPSGTRSHGATSQGSMREPSNGHEGLAMLRHQWVNGCLEFDEQAAEAILSSAFALFPVEVVCTQLIQRGLAAIGNGWNEGKITVQQEHFASSLAVRRIEALLASAPPSIRPERIIVGCPPEEVHTFAPLVLSLLLKRRGWNVIYLGADVPIASMETTVQSTQPALVILTAQRLPTAATLLAMAEVLFDLDVPVAFGGLVFNHVENLHEVIPGVFLGSRLDAAAGNVESLLPYARPQAAERIVPQEALTAARKFSERRPLIEAEVWRGMAYSGIPLRDLSSANASLGRNIAASLSLGSMDYLGTDMAWVERTVFNLRSIPAHLPVDYLNLYLGAAKEHLESDGAPIVAWLGRLLGVNTNVNALSKQSAWRIGQA